jgi:hypothetical protein
MIFVDPVRYFRPPYVGRRGWVGVRIDRHPDWTVVARLVEQAYRMVAPARAPAARSHAARPRATRPRTPGSRAAKSPAPRSRAVPATRDATTRAKPPDKAAGTAQRRGAARAPLSLRRGPTGGIGRCE